MSDPNQYLALVRSRTVFKDGAMGTQIQDAELDDSATTAATRATSTT